MDEDSVQQPEADRTSYTGSRSVGLPNKSGTQGASQDTSLKEWEQEASAKGHWGGSVLRSGQTKRAGEQPTD